jgi:hypothetical protein
MHAVQLIIGCSCGRSVEQLGDPVPGGGELLPPGDQVFLLSAPFRKRRRSRVLNGSLWVAYLMADYVATYLLGRLALLVAVSGGDGTRPQLALLWAPFLLLHLGGQETITAFSMEDNTLWKRRALLDFTVGYFGSTSVNRRTEDMGERSTSP